jgi:hypothetical protein
MSVEWAIVDIDGNEAKKGTCSACHMEKYIYVKTTKYFYPAVVHPGKASDFTPVDLCIDCFGEGYKVT